MDEETARMLDFADQCFHLSDGLFDITSGVLRKVWQFDGSDNLPDQSDVEPLLRTGGLAKSDLAVTLFFTSRWHADRLRRHR